MDESRKLRRRQREARPRERPALGAASPPRPVPAAPEAEGDAVRGLLGASSKPAGRFDRAWRLTKPLLVLALVAGLAMPVIFWARYHAQNVTSKNAAVRGQLAEIGSRLTGLVTKVEVDAGDRVKAGQVLVRLEDRHLRAEVQEARAVVEGLQRTIDVERLNVSHERRRIEQQENEAEARLQAANAQTAAARIQAEEARREYELRQSLYTHDGVVSSEDVRASETRRRTSDAKLDEARANSAAAKSAGETVRLAGDAVGIQERKVGVLEAELEQAQARVARAEADLDGTLLRAPGDGAIVRRIVQPGGSVESGQPIISMWLGSDVWIEAWIDEDDIGAVSLGSIATVQFHSFPGREFTGVVDKIGLATDLELPDSAVPQPRFTRMRSAPVVGVRIRLDNPPVELLPGLSAIVAIRKAG